MSKKDISLDLLREIVESYDTNVINKCPSSGNELYCYYHKYTEKLLKYFISEIGELPYVLGNEVRAMFGHLTKHNVKVDYSNSELKKAYGHFRRLNLDAFKILCDEFDKSFFYFIKKSHKYNFKKVSKDFLFNYSERYFVAQKAFLDAQFSESVGRNDEANVYDAYFKAFCLYASLNNYHFENIEKINKIRRRTHCLNFISATISTIMIIGSLVSLVPIPIP